MRSAPRGDLSKISARMLRGERVREDVRVPVLTLQSETDLSQVVAALRPTGGRSGSVDGRQ